MNTRKHRMIARNPRNRQVKKMRFVLGLLVAVALLAIFGWVGRTDYRTELWEKTIQACEAETRQCMPLTREVQKDPKARVIMDGTGRTWIEYK